MFLQIEILLIRMILTLYSNTFRLKTEPKASIPFTMERFLSTKCKSLVHTSFILSNLFNYIIQVLTGLLTGIFFGNRG